MPSRPVLRIPALSSRPASPEWFLRSPHKDILPVQHPQRVRCGHSAHPTRQSSQADPERNLLSLRLPLCPQLPFPARNPESARLLRSAAPRQTQAPPTPQCRFRSHRTQPELQPSDIYPCSLFFGPFSSSFPHNLSVHNRFMYTLSAWLQRGFSFITDMLTTIAIPVKILQNYCRPWLLFSRKLNRNDHDLSKCHSDLSIG